MNTEPNTIDELMETFYRTISFAPGSKPDYASFQSLFHVTGRVTPPIEDTGGVIAVKNAKEFADSFDATIEREKLVKVGAQETELDRHTLTFGRTAVVSSSYEFCLKGSKTPLARGVNSLLLVFDCDRWWIISLSWDRATKGEQPLMVHTTSSASDISSKTR